MEAVNKLCSCRFEPLVEVPVPEKAVVWTSKNYYDGSGAALLLLLLLLFFTCC